MLSDETLRATLVINSADAQNGTSRTITLPSGRRVEITVPAGAYDGQIIRLEGESDPDNSQGTSGEILITLVIKQVEDPLDTISDKPTRVVADKPTIRDISITDEPTIRTIADDTTARRMPISL